MSDWIVHTGDCRAILPTLRIGALITDPPFGMDFRSNYRQERWNDIAGDGTDELLQELCGVPVEHSRYVFCRWDNLRDIPKPKSVVTWVKNNWSMGDLDHEHARQTESIAFWPGPSHDWPESRPADVVFHDRTGNDNHPTEKPLSLMLQIVRWTRGLVVDPCCGSGTKGMACRILGRPFIGIEIDPGYADIARRRIAAALNPQTYRDDRAIDSPLFAAAPPVG